MPLQNSRGRGQTKYNTSQAIRKWRMTWVKSSKSSWMSIGFNSPMITDKTRGLLLTLEGPRHMGKSLILIISEYNRVCLLPGIVNRTHRKEKKSIEPNRTFDFRTRDLCKTDVENPLPDLRSSSYFSPECSARVFRKRRNSAEMAWDALWIVSFKCIVTSYSLVHC